MTTLFYILVVLFFALPAKAQLMDVEKAGLPAIQNIANNPGFESALAGWTATGVNPSLDTTNFAFGKASLAWDSNAAAQVLRSKQITIPQGLYGKNIVFGCSIKTPSGTATHQIGLYDGTTETNLTTITSSTQFARTTVNTVAPSSGTLGVVIRSVASNEPSINVDDCFIADANFVNISQVNQAQLVGTLTYSGATNCVWSSDTAGYSNFASDTDCPTPTVTGSLTAPGTKIPGAVLSNAQPGNYQVIVQARLGTGSSASTLCEYRINDGTNSSGFHGNYASGAPDINTGSSLNGSFNYTTVQSSITWQVQNAEPLSTAGSCSIQNSSSVDSFIIYVYRFPTQSELAFRPEQQAVVSSLKYTGQANCSWSFTSGTMASISADSDCATAVVTGNATAPGTKLLNFTYNSLPAGKYLVQAQGLIYTSTTAGTLCITELYDGTSRVGNAAAYAGSTTDIITPLSLSGVFEYSSAGNRTFEIRGMRQVGSGTCAIQNDISDKSLTLTLIPLTPSITAPILVGSVTSSSLGAERIERVKVTTACSVATCTMASNTPGVTSVTRDSTGLYNINFASGIFSAAPTCNYAGSAGAQYLAVPYAQASYTTIKAQVTTLNSSFTAVDGIFDAVCIGPR
jgi:hypothetical protein